MKLSECDVKKILELKKRGATTKEIADMFGVSLRRIQQILQNPQLKRPGRRRTEIPSELKDKIIKMRIAGYTIDGIKKALEREGYSISKYKIWKAIREQKEREFIKVVEEFRFLYNGYDHVLFVGVSPLISCEDERSLKFLLMCNVFDCNTFYCNAFESLTLEKVINTFDSHVRRFQKPELVIICPTLPLVPTRCSSNKFTRHLKNLGIPYVWFPESLKKTCRGEIERIKNLFRENCSCSHYLIKEIKENCKELLEVHQHGSTGKNKEVFESPDCGGNKKF